MKLVFLLLLLFLGTIAASQTRCKNLFPPSKYEIEIGLNSYNHELCILHENRYTNHRAFNNFYVDLENDMTRFKLNRQFATLHYRFKTLDDFCNINYKDNVVDVAMCKCLHIDNPYANKLTCETTALLLKPEEKCQRLKHMLVPVGSFLAMAAGTIYSSDNQYVNVAMVGVTVTSTSTEIVAYAGAAKAITTTSAIAIAPYIIPVAALATVGAIVYCNT